MFILCKVTSSMVTIQRQMQQHTTTYIQLLCCAAPSVPWWHVINADLVRALDQMQVHPTDLGHWRIAEFYSKFLPPLLANKGLANKALFAPQARLQAPAPIAGTDAEAELRSPPSDTEATVIWKNFTSLQIEGRAFNDTPTPFNRLPTAAKSTVREAVWSLGLNSAGLNVRFESNAPSIEIQYTLASAAGVGSPHFPASGMSGADLYALDEAVDPPAWKYVGTRQNLQSGTAQSGSVATNLPTDRMTSYRLYLPTYNTVVDGAIGVPQGSTIQLDSRAGFKEPAVVWYLTPIRYTLLSTQWSAGFISLGW